jgi:hypothetical protein
VRMVECLWDSSNTNDGVYCRLDLDIQEYHDRCARYSKLLSEQSVMDSNVLVSYVWSEQSFA